MRQTQPSLSLVRSRCAAVGAALAVTFGFGGLHLAVAAPEAIVRNVFVPIVPCRLFDTRPAESTVGDRNVPIVSDTPFVAFVRGSNGNCVISSGATAVVLNLTAVDPTTDGFLTVWPAENPRPNTSNLNFSAGQAPVANSVTVKLDSQGAIKFLTTAATLNVIADVVGYFEDHNHNDLYKPIVPTVLSTSILNTTTTTAPRVYDVPGGSSAIANGSALRAFLEGKSNRIVTLAAATYDIGSDPITVPVGVTLKGVAQDATKIIGNSTVGLFLPIVILSATSTLQDVSVLGSGGGAGVEARTISGSMATIVNVNIDVSATNGSVYNSGSGDLVMRNVRTRSRYGVNNGGTGGTQTGQILIYNSDIDGVVQNASGGSITVTDSEIGSQTGTPVLTPESGVTAYKSGHITLHNVMVSSRVVGIWATDLASSIDVFDGSITSINPRQSASNGPTTCLNVAKTIGVLSPTCT